MPDKGRCIMLYGKAGRGKTTLLNTLTGNILLINIDCGEQVLDASNENNQFDICTLVSHNLNDPIAAIDKLEEFVTWLGEQDKLPWDYIAVDNISELEDVYANSLREQRTQEYSENFLMPDVSLDILNILKKLRNLTYLGPDVLFLAWEKTLKVSDKDGEVTSEKGPMITGLSQLKLSGLVDFVMAMRVDKQGSRYLQLDADHKYDCKLREEPGVSYPTTIECPKSSTDTLQNFFDLVHKRRSDDG